MKTDEPPDGYVEAIQAMGNAGKAWVREHPFACLVLNPVDPDKLPVDEPTRVHLRALLRSDPHAKVGVIGSLRDSIEWWAGNEPTRDLLSAMDRAAGARRPTYQMAECALELFVFPKQEATS
jgi:hypothetical protein